MKMAEESSKALVYEDLLGECIGLRERADAAEARVAEMEAQVAEAERQRDVAIASKNEWQESAQLSVKFCEDVRVIANLAPADWREQWFQLATKNRACMRQRDDAIERADAAEAKAALATASWKSAEAEAERLREALEWYADEDRYIPLGDCGLWPEAQDDAGQRARAALGRE